MWHRGDRLLGVIVLACLLTVVGSASAWGQIRAMPANTTGGDRPAGGVFAYGGPLYDPVSAVSAIEEIPGDSASLIETEIVYDHHSVVGSYVSSADCWTWQALPKGLMFKSYLAGNRESRIATVWHYVKGEGWLWDVALGGRVGMIRFGTEDEACPEGWQIDVEGAAFPRLSLARGRDLVSTDFRFGIPLTYRRGPWEAMFSYYHLSSHLADEYMVAFPAATRINYVRDALVMAVAWRPNPDVRLYAETAWAFFTDGGAKPWQFQFGVDYSPAAPTGFWGAPFLAVNGEIREEVDFGGSFTLQTGWQWRAEAGHLLRLGMHYFNGMSNQFQFYRQHEEQIGAGLWYDY